MRVHLSDVSSLGVLVFDPDAGSAGTGDLVKTYPISNCSGNGNWIDPVTNTMLVGCNNAAGQALISLADGTTLGAISPGHDRRCHGF